MKLFPVVAIAFGALIFAAPLSAQQYRSDDLKFQIEFPAPPDRNTRRLTMRSSPVDVVRFMARGKGVRAALTVVEFDRRAFSKAEARYALKQSRDHQVSVVKGEIAEERDLEIGGMPAKDFIITFGPPERNLQYRARTVYIGNRQFTASVIGTATDVSAPEAQAYLDSFKPWE